MSKLARIVPETGIQPTASTRVKTSKKSTSQPEQVLPYAADSTKHQRILALLHRAEGASIAELQSATNWQAHSVRGFLSATVRKKLALPLIAELRPSGERVYRIVGGEHV